MNFILDFFNGKTNGNTYVQVGFLGSLVLGFFVYNYHMEYLYSASSSDHALLVRIITQGFSLALIVLGFSGSLYLGVWRYMRHNGDEKWLLIVLGVVHVLAFTALSGLLVGSHIYRASDGLLTKEHHSLRIKLDD